MTHVPRLIHLVKFLEKLPPDRYAIDKWMMPDDRSTYQESFVFREGMISRLGAFFGRERSKEVLADPTRCVGCALSWAATIPLFHEQGLKLVSSGEDLELGRYHISYRGYLDYFAASEFFNLSFEEAHMIFDVNRYGENDHASLYNVIARINIYLNDAIKIRKINQVKPQIRSENPIPDFFYAESKPQVIYPQ